MHLSCSAQKKCRFARHHRIIRALVLAGSISAAITDIRNRAFGPTALGFLLPYCFCEGHGLDNYTLQEDSSPSSTTHLESTN